MAVVGVVVDGRVVVVGGAEGITVITFESVKPLPGSTRSIFQRVGRAWNTSSHNLPSCRSSSRTGRTLVRICIQVVGKQTQFNVGRVVPSADGERNADVGVVRSLRKPGAVQGLVDEEVPPAPLRTRGNCQRSQRGDALQRSCEGATDTATGRAGGCGHDSPDRPSSRRAWKDVHGQRLLVPLDTISVGANTCSMPTEIVTRTQQCPYCLLPTVLVTIEQLVSLRGDVVACRPCSTRRDARTRSALARGLCRGECSDQRRCRLSAVETGFRLL